MRGLRLAIGMVAVLPGVTSAQTPAGPPPLRTLTRTMYTPRTELFAEFRPLVVGESVRITAHLTKVANVFRPYTEGTVKLTLTVDNAQVEVTANGPERAGVFRLPITPTKAGTGRIVVELLSLLPPERFVLEGVPVYANTRAALAKEVPEEAGLISYAKERPGRPTLRPRRWRCIPGAGSIVMVSATTIVHNGDSTRVYVQRTPERFELREVKTRRTVAERIEITSGLREGERIVVKGADAMPRRN